MEHSSRLNSFLSLAWKEHRLFCMEKLKLLLIQLLFISSNFYVKCDRKEPKHPHLILVTLRDLGFDDVSFHGNPQIPTPNIDRIANHGVILQQYYVTPRCEDSISALKTGKHPVHYRAPTPGDTGPFSYDLWNYLDIQGYVVREVGTIQCKDTTMPFYPWDVVREAEYVLRDHDQNYPLFLQVNFPQLHADVPEQVPEEYIIRASKIPSEARRIYAAMVMQLDRAVGHLIRLLYDTGILHDAIVFFTTLTGATQSFNLYTWPSNFPFRGGNGTFWEGGSRAIGFIYSNRIEKKARVTHGLMHITDLLPTLFRLAGGNPDHVVDADGYDVWDTLNLEQYSPRKDVLYGIYGDRAAIRVGDYKVIKNEPALPLNPRPMGKGELESLMAPVMVWDAQLHCPEYPDAIGCWPELSPCLFNVRDDPCESNNVAYYMPQTVEALTYALNKYNETARYRTRRNLGASKRFIRDKDFRRTVERLNESKKKFDKNRL